MVVERANAELRAKHNLPRSGGRCPLCGHNGCFGRLRGEAAQWVCYSSSHPAAMGRQGKGCVWGDLIDLELALAGILATATARIEWLQARGLLTAIWSGPRPTQGPPTVGEELLHFVLDPASFEAARSLKILTPRQVSAILHAARSDAPALRTPSET